MASPPIPSHQTALKHTSLSPLYHCAQLQDRVYNINHAVLTATGFPRPIANPLVPSGIRGPGGCFATAICSLLTKLLGAGGVPTWLPRLLWWLLWYWARPRPFPRPLFRPFFCPHSLSLECSSPCTRWIMVWHSILKIEIKAGMWWKRKACFPAPRKLQYQCQINAL